MEYYGYIKTNGTPPENNFWKSENSITLNDDTVVIGYEGPQSESDENVEVIGDAATFNKWLKENTAQSNIQQ
jgi:hypothetical protein